jgi:HPr kinase/phosphorylase
MQRELGEVTTLHGVFLDVLEIGVLITGDSSIGKSELALELISRGHGLVADDVVELQQIGPRRSRGAARRCCATSSRCAGSGCSTSARSSARRPCARERRFASS